MTSWAAFLWYFCCTNEKSSCHRLAVVSAWNVLTQRFSTSQYLVLSMTFQTNSFYCSPHLCFPWDRIQTSLRQLIDSLPPPPSSQHLQLKNFFLWWWTTVDSRIVPDPERIWDEWMTSSLSEYSSVICMNFLGCCQQQNPDLHWFPAKACIPILL